MEKEFLDALDRITRRIDLIEKAMHELRAAHDGLVRAFDPNLEAQIKDLARRLGQVEGKLGVTHED